MDRPRYRPTEWARVNEPLFLGWNAESGRRVFVDTKQRSTHMMDIGRSGAGKTTHYEYMIRQDIAARRGVCVIDPEGTLYTRLVHYCARRRGTWDRVVLIDPNDDPYRFGLNYFDLAHLTPQQRVDSFIQACYRILKQTDQSLMPTFQRWGDAGALPLASYPPEPLTMAELHRFLIDDDFREAVLSQLPNGAHARREWQHWSENLSKADRQSAILAVLNRAALFTKDPRAEEILGQCNQIDWLDAMDAGKIVLVNLQADKITRELSQMLGIMLIHQVVSAGERRQEHKLNRPFYVYVDELATMATPDFAEAFKRLRKRSTPFIVAMQDLADLDLDDRGKLRSAVMNSSDTKLVFGMHNPDDAMELAKAIFASEIATDRIKYQGEAATSAIPIPKSREVEVVTRTRTSTHGGGSVSGSAGGESQQDSEGTSFSADHDELLTMSGLTRGSSSAWSEQSSDSWSESEGESRTMHTERWTEYEYERIPPTPVYYTPEEIAQKYAAAIMRQGVGFALLKYDPQKPAVLIRTPAPGSREFPDVVAVPSLVQAFREHVYARLKVPTATEARAMIEARQQRVLELPASRVDVLEGPLPSEEELKLKLGIESPKPTKRAVRSKAKPTKSP